jgi:hypothetical protein
MEKVEFRKEFNCARCQKPFTIQKHYQLFCSDWCEDTTNAVMQCVEDRRHNKTCRDCGKQFRSPTGFSAKCGSCVYSDKQKAIENLNIANRKQSTKQRRRGKGITFQELIRRSEYKRVFDDSGWSHYLKGRKWDRI